MTNDDSKHELDPQLLPDDGPTDPEKIASDQLAHALLDHVRLDDRDQQRARIDRVMNAINTQEVHRPRRLVIWSMSSLATAAALVLLVLVGPWSRSASAVDIVNGAIVRSGDRTFDVGLIAQGEEGDELRHVATFYTRDSDHVLIEARGWQDRFMFCRRPEGAWAIRPDGYVRRFSRDGPMPRWMQFGQNTVLSESVDELLASLPEEYELKLLERQTINGVRCHHVEARRPKRPSHRPARIVALIEEKQPKLRRLELHWPPRKGEFPEDQFKHCIGPWDPARNGETAPHDGAQRPHRRPDRDLTGDDGASNDDPPGRRGRRPRHERPGPDANGLAIEEGEPARMREFRKRRHFGQRRPPPPRRIVFDLVGSDDLPPDWFEPETHAVEDWSERLESPRPGRIGGPRG